MVAKFVQSDYTTQSGTAYPLALDADIAVLAEQAAQFAVSAQDTPNLTVAMRAGRLLTGARLLVAVAAQNSASLTAPTGNPRKDIVYIDATTGAIGVAQGAESATPADPAIPPNKLPKARINWTVGASSITNSMLDDLRLDAPSLDAVYNWVLNNGGFALDSEVAPLAKQFVVRLAMDAPVVAAVAGGSLGARTYYVKYCYTDASDSTESFVSPEVSITLPAGQLLKITSPTTPSPSGTSGTQWYRWRAFVSTASGTETRQSTQNLGTDWTEPTTGLVSGAAMPNKLGVVLTPGNVSYRDGSNTKLTVQAKNFQVLLLTNADASNPRIDRICVSRGFAYGTGVSGNALVITGTPGATPAAPDYSPGVHPIAQIYVPANATSILAANVTDERCLLESDDLAAVQAVNTLPYINMLDNRVVYAPFTADASVSINNPGTQRTTVIIKNTDSVSHNITGFGGITSGAPSTPYTLAAGKVLVLELVSAAGTCWCTSYSGPL